LHIIIFWNNDYYNYFVTTLHVLFVRRGHSPLPFYVYPCPTCWWFIWTAETCSSVK